MRRVGITMVTLALAAGILNLTSAQGGVLPKTFTCTGDAWVDNSSFGDPVYGATSGFAIFGATLFCHDEKGTFGFKGTVTTLDGTIQGSGTCVDPTNAEPGNITVRADVQIDIWYENAEKLDKKKKNWKIFRTLTGESESPIPGGRILGKVRLPGGAGKVGTFLVQPMGAATDCVAQFQTVRFYDLLVGPAIVG